MAKKKKKRQSRKNSFDERKLKVEPLVQKNSKQDLQDNKVLSWQQKLALTWQAAKLKIKGVILKLKSLFIKAYKAIGEVFRKIKIPSSLKNSWQQFSKKSIEYWQYFWQNFREGLRVIKEFLVFVYQKKISPFFVKLGQLGRSVGQEIKKDWVNMIAKIKKINLNWLKFTKPKNQAKAQDKNTKLIRQQLTQKDSDQQNQEAEKVKEPESKTSKLRAAYGQLKSNAQDQAKMTVQKTKRPSSIPLLILRIIWKVLKTIVIYLVIFILLLGVLALASGWAFFSQLDPVVLILIVAGYAVVTFIYALVAIRRLKRYRSGFKVVMATVYLLLFVSPFLSFAFGYERAKVWLTTNAAGENIMPSINDFDNVSFPETNVYQDSSGNRLYREFQDNHNRLSVPISQVSPHFIDAIIAYEDQRFYEHVGLDVMGILRALKVNLQSSGIEEGASTITQQLVEITMLKNLDIKEPLSALDRYKLKAQEIILSWQLEQRYSKDEILEMYVNRVPFGNNAYGIRMAAEIYFQKKPQDLTIIESAILASLPNSPTGKSPFSNRDRLMGYCTAEIKEENTADPIQENIEQTEPTEEEAQEELPPEPQDELGVSQEPVEFDLASEQYEQISAALDQEEKMEFNNLLIPKNKLLVVVKAKEPVWTRLTVNGKVTEGTIAKGATKLFLTDQNFQVYGGNEHLQVFINGFEVNNYLPLTELVYELETWQEKINPEVIVDIPELFPKADAVNNQEPLLEGDCPTMYSEGYHKGAKDYVLERMLDDGRITDAEFQEAFNQGKEITFTPYSSKMAYPHFVVYAQDQLQELLTSDEDNYYYQDLIKEGGLSVQTTIDPEIQKAVEQIVAEEFPAISKRYRANNVAAVVIEVKTGAVRAMVGSKDFYNETIDGEVNVATALRQPGSSFKPITFAAAIEEKGYGSGQFITDYPTKFEGRTPRNSDNSYDGKTTFRRSLARSRNIPAIKAYYLAGQEEAVLKTAEKLGIESLRETKRKINEKHGENYYTYGYPLAIGSGTIQLVELASAYATFANGGVRKPVTPFAEIKDKEGQIVFKLADNPSIPAINPQTAFVITSMLTDVNARPAGVWRNTLTVPGHTVAAKTGTSNKGNYPNNLLTAGYNHEYAVAVWVGNTDNTVMSSRAYGLFTAAPIWKRIMLKLTEGKEDVIFEAPEGIIKKVYEYYPSWGPGGSVPSIDKQFDSVDLEERRKEEEEKKRQEEEQKRRQEEAARAEEAADPEPTPEPDPTPTPQPMPDPQNNNGLSAEVDRG
jgi:membrane peptidoglycan carboxypeptidase